MPYYAGDYYRGDFLGIGKALKRVVGTVAGVAGKLLPGPAGFIAGQLARGISVSRNPTAAAAPFGGMFLPPLQQRGVVNIGPGPQTGVLNIGGGGSISRKTTYEARGYYDAAGQFHRRGRRMNVTNVRALRRAGRRVRGFLKLARRMGALPVSHSGKKLFKAHRRSRK